MMHRRQCALGVSEQGFALAGATILAFAMVLVGMAFAALGGYEARDSQVQLDSQRAFWLAEAGRERALGWMVAQSQAGQKPPDADRNIYTNTAGPDGGTYTVDCIVDPAGLLSAEKRFVLDCVGRFGGVERRIRANIKMTSFAQYAYFSNSETSSSGENIWFLTTDQVHGLIHTNGTFYISGRPRFYDKVTSAQTRMIGYPSYSIYDAGDWPVGGNNPTFDDGFQLNTQQIPLPTQTLDLKTEAQTGGRYVTTASIIELGKNGTSTAGTVNRGWLRYKKTSGGSWTQLQISTLTKKVLYVAAAVQISGKLDGELTVASSSSLTIIDDVTYWDVDASFVPLPTCNDLLGLVAQTNIIFKNSPATVDLKVHAVMMALHSSITAENYSTRGPCGTLTIYGGLIQQNRGAVCTFTPGGSISSGYAKDYHYDTRVTARTPPAFPLTGVYQKVSWAETWDTSAPF